MTRASMALLLMLGLSACSTIDSSHILTGPPQQPGAASHVRVFLEGQNPPTGYREIAIVEGHGDSGVRMPDVIDHLKEDAARLGANALINVRVAQGSVVISVVAVAVRY